MASAYDIVMESRKELVDKIVDMMKSGMKLNASTWNLNALSPYNPLSGVQYSGGNRMRLMTSVLMNEYTDPRWGTYKQYKEKGFYPSKGEKGVKCEKWIFDKEIKSKDKTGNEQIERVRLTKPIVSYFTVFNAEQIENFPKYRGREPNNEKSFIDELIGSSDCPIKELAQSDAFYSPDKDTIYLPLREVFKDESSFITTVLHEMGHSTGHESRLGRDLKAKFGTAEYAKEELRAELSSLFFATDMGVHLQGEHYVDHSDYLRSWMQAVENDYNEFFRACADAERISEYLKTNYLKKYPEKADALQHEIAEQKRLFSGHCDKKIKAEWGYVTLTLTQQPGWSSYEKALASWQIDKYGVTITDANNSPIDDKRLLATLEERGIVSVGREKNKEVKLNPCL